ncbi:O-antigen ligase family protein [Domibacillus sp. DTU_2020_1001157_1_SI_ALB_TIR_016]|uniref:O-antigen ligase family protein n=1 Tax=Domibacillus sp. DTU_2020_1001157_1_SI_ALB_TIR_016 TaxID=3077789 RepID=UPI0028EE8FBD|nr:O-antigen ligase family protein [Domibacillus sp. DTU_2020_1001157_1_SI_ALB_TIR_016]WNS81209.1 O-antigen ligase family protein [Domibacillus sp. DTU_2020_1001157_1_SI_ALB_TIR_016]
MRHIPFLFLLLTIFAIPWENAVVLPGLGTIVRPIGILAFLLTALLVVKNGTYRKLAPIHYALLIFILWSGLSIIWSVDPELTLTRIKTYAQLFIMIWLIWELVRTEAQMNIVLQAYVLGAWVAVASTVFNFLTADQVMYGRYSANGFDPNDLGVMLALGIPIAWYLFMKQKNWFFRLSNAAYLAMAMWTISLTASRTAFVVGLIGLLYVGFTFSHLTKRMKILLVLFLAVGVTYGIQSVPAESLKRIETIGEDVGQGDLNGRGAFWAAGFTMVEEQPLIGIGAGAYPREMEILIDKHDLSHNTPLAVLAETGIIGLLLFLSIIVSFVYTASKTSYLEAVLFLSLLAVWGLSTMFLTWEMRKPTWLLFGLIALESAKWQVRPALLFAKRIQFVRE